MVRCDINVLNVYKVDEVYRLAILAVMGLLGLSLETTDSFQGKKGERMEGTGVGNENEKSRRSADVSVFNIVL